MKTNAGSSPPKVLDRILTYIQNVGTNSVFKQHFSSKALGVLFVDGIFLVRIINTCISLGVAIKYYPDNL